MKHDISQVIKNFLDELVGKKVYIYTLTERSSDYKFHNNGYSRISIPPPETIGEYDITSEKIIQYEFEDAFNHYPTATFYFIGRKPIEYLVGEQSQPFETVD